jgi:UDP-GlcNAc:undecaprenyl-phosphate GlcNAc-1-phosphate transferase
MNGLCAGLGGIATAALSGWCMMTNRPVLAAICLAAAGGCIGVLPFNYPRASLFVGDAGSHLIGFLAVSLALLACTPLPEAAPRHSWVPLVVLLVPFYDIIQVVVVRTLAGNPVYIGDTNHVSHQLVRAGLSPSVAVLCLWLLGGVAGVAVVTLAR